VHYSACPIRAIFWKTADLHREQAIFQVEVTNMTNLTLGQVCQ